MSRNSPDTIVCRSDGIDYTLSDFTLGVGNNGQSPLCNQAKKINEIAKIIYKKLNPEFYKKHLGLLERFTVWIFSYTSSSLFNLKLSGIITKYLYNTKDVEINLLKNSNYFFPYPTSFPKHSFLTIPTSQSIESVDSLHRVSSCPSMPSSFDNAPSVDNKSILNDDSYLDNEYTLENFIFRRKLAERKIAIETLSEDKRLAWHADLQVEIDNEIESLRHQ